MKHITLSIGLLFLFFSSIPFSTAQIKDDASSVSTMNLEACIDYALSQNENLKKAAIEVDLAEYLIQENKAIGLPQISAQAQFINNFKVQRTILPDGTLFGGPPGPIAVEFQPQYSASAGLTYNQLIFDFSYLVGLKAARAYKELTRRSSLSSQVDIAEAVAKAYYGVLITRARLTLLDQNYARLDSLLRETTAFYKNGFVEKIDVDRTEVAFNNVRSERQKVVQLIDFSLKVLKFQMGMNLHDSLTLADDLALITLDSAALQSNATVDYSKRPEYQLLQARRDILALDVRYRRSTLYPSLVGFVNIGANMGGTRLGDVTSNSRWFQYGFFGFQLNIPIMNGFRTRQTIAKAKLELEKLSYDFEYFERGADFQAEQAQNSLKVSLIDLDIQKKNMDLAQEISRTARIKYANGVGTNLEIINAETSYKEAEVNYYNALYNAIIAQVELQKAFGTLIDAKPVR
ncbi:MAG: TolC family protein [Cytophagales bacterium]|nr:MAG: TolC family protein [Cytophagales bacterium]